MHAAVQANRTTWASTELLAAAIVVNAPVLYGAFNIWRQRSRRKSQRLAPRAGASSTIRTIGSGGKQPKRLSNVPKDDEELMLQPCRQTSITSCTSLQDPQSEDGATKKPDLGSYEEADRNRAQASNWIRQPPFFKIIGRIRFMQVHLVERYSTRAGQTSVLPAQCFTC